MDFMKALTKGQQRTQGDIADGKLAESTQDNLGAYTIQAGDSLEQIALQVYGDSSLWYVLADANGINDKSTKAGKDSPLHVGQRINIPTVSTGQHHTQNTHKVLNGNSIIGNTSASMPLPHTTPIASRKAQPVFKNNSSSGSCSSLSTNRRYNRYTSHSRRSSWRLRLLKFHIWHGF